MDINSFLKTLSENWSGILKNLVYQTKFHFDNNKIDLDFSNLKLDNIPNTFGVYLFKIIPDKDFNLKKFNQNWKPKKSGLKRPNIIKNNCAKSDFGCEYNFYLGKSEKLQSRIKEHCIHDFDKSTYSLKLKDNTVLQGSKISVTYFILENINDFKQNKEVLQFVITNLEKTLRKELKPWVGKQ